MGQNNSASANSVATLQRKVQDAKAKNRRSAAGHGRCNADRMIPQRA